MSENLSAPLPVPKEALGDAIDMQVQESIHGHRFVQEQEPYMIVLETLAVCAVQPLGSTKPVENAHEAFQYALPHRRKLRFLLFQDRHLDHVAEDRTIPDQDKWETWKARANDQFYPNHKGQDAFAYLDEAFECDVKALRQAVRLLRSQEVDVMHNRRWTSRFLAVTGPDMICTDMREKQGSWTADRRFFGRGGELVYLMLNRSTQVDEVSALVTQRILNKDDPMNQIARALSDPAGSGQASTHIGYLPYRHLPAYDRLAEDWFNILSCNRLPEGHLFEPLFRITGLNLIVYLAERAQTEMNAAAREPIIADLTDGGNAHLRDDAKKHLNLHRDAANGAVRAFITRGLAEDEAWGKALELDDPGVAKRVIAERFSFKAKDENARSPEGQVEALIEKAISRDKNNVYRYLLPLAKGSGLVTSRQRVGPWFALDDSLLFALVLANADKTIELREFVARLYERYGLVIGPQEARNAFGRIHAERFEENLSALEARLTRLALTQRLSDDCAFVINPYREPQKIHE